MEPTITPKSMKYIQFEQHISRFSIRVCVLQWITRFPNSATENNIFRWNDQLSILNDQFYSSLWYFPIEDRLIFMGKGYFFMDYYLKRCKTTPKLMKIFHFWLQKHVYKTRRKWGLIIVPAKIMADICHFGLDQQLSFGKYDNRITKLKILRRVFIHVFL